MSSRRSALVCFLLSLVGLGLSAYLIYLHLGLMRGEFLGGPACSAGAFNCHAVTGGAWGQLLGVPLAFWGTLGYLTVFALSVLAQQAPDLASDALTLIFLLAVAFVAIDVALLGLMVFVIRFYCLFCFATYAVNLALAVVSAAALGAPWPQAFRRLGRALGALWPSPSRRAAGVFWAMMFLAVAGTVAVHASTNFVSRGPSGAMRKQLREFIQKQPRVSVEVSGDPTLGAAGAPIRLVEFSDFLCPSCQRASKLNTIIFAGHRRDVAFTFKHYPLDPTCNDQVKRMVHPGACQLAAASECAHLQGKFWPFHDLVFERGQPYNLSDLDADVARAGLDVARFRACLASGQGIEAVRRDVAEGVKVKVTSTPTYVVNGVPIAGGLTPATFEEILAVLRE